MQAGDNTLEEWDAILCVDWSIEVTKHASCVFTDYKEPPQWSPLGWFDEMSKNKK